ncbi:NUDIX hydrolase [Cohnella lubricantis]|uniref:NUDIX hydrolase n=1 Tax=Cohnella lubricantis TaxID=2163172 RepID=A0A841TBQ1_9BACL|nr:NUDIX hydrolase [Cohnella lubricantis]MBB6676670.1 NUDIX hydrolase [Cohnella lubricantis]MBP2120412.1 8-oxo-dGTP pyrophosphatase MutT (NUDIX family) [Cohnella lubricantis]
MFYVNSRAIIERYADGELEIVIQTRTKPNESERIELPGGRIEPYESLIAAVIREVKEETGLDLIEIEGEELRIITNGTDFEVECLTPFAAYQTIKGPVDSVGYYFRCKAKGELLVTGDDTTGIRWISVKKLNAMFAENPLQFSDIDQAGIKIYLKSLQSKG